VRKAARQPETIFKSKAKKNTLLKPVIMLSTIYSFISRRRWLKGTAQYAANKKIGVLILLPGIMGGLYAQPNITRAEYYIDTDPGYGNATTIAMVPGPNLAGLTFSIDMAPLSQGVHIAGIRSRDANGAWSLDNKWLFVKPFATSSTSVSNINRAEWYLDTDPGYGNATPVALSPGQNLAGLSFSIDIPPLSEGVHIVGVRSRDVNGAWSHDNRWLFVKPYSASGTSVPNINRAEWYLDTDPGYGKANPVAITPDQNLPGLSFNIDIPPLFEGVHIVGIRSRDANGVWSLDNRWLFVKPYSTSAIAVPNITRVEWYIDTDPGYGNATSVPISPGQNLSSLSFSQNLASLNPGVHILGVRSRDANGAWSLDHKWLFIKPYPGSPARMITQAEYYLDADPGYGNGIQIALGPKNNLQAKEIFANISGISAGKHYIYIRSRDNLQTWSFDYVDSFTIAAPVSAPVILINSIAKNNLCVRDSISVGYDASGSYTANNTFKVFISNSAGDFAGETEIGSVTSTADGIIKCYIPQGIPDGAGYKLRVKSSNPSLTSATADFTLSLYDRPFFSNDTTVFITCSPDVFNLNTVFKSGGYTLKWNTANPAVAPIGGYQLIAINANGCSDTVNVAVALEIATWTGTSSTSWHTPGNWNTGKVPGSQTHVKIPGGTPNNCVLSTANGTAASMEVKPGAIFNAINGRTVVITGKCSPIPPG
jgi:hypothetical protein